MERKKCKHCNKWFKKKYKYGKKQWEKTIFCSRKCYAKDKKGMIVSQETRDKLSKAHKGTKKPWSGKYKHTKEHNINIGKSVRKALQERGEEIGEKISKALTGRKNSRQTIVKMRIAQTKRKTYKGGKKTEKKRACFYERTRRVRKYCNGGSHTLNEWEELKSKHNFTCPCCGKKEPKIKLTEDHIIPLSKGGSDDIKNIQPLCYKCNSSKYTKNIKYAIKKRTTEK